MELLADIAGFTPSPPMVPADRTIDLAHLSRMTMGDRGLECEVLSLFGRQARMLLLRMRDAPPDIVAASAHTLKGSATGVGAWRVARAAEILESTASASDTDLVPAIDELGASVDEARHVIADLIRAH